jgi:hypothetical protein
MIIGLKLSFKRDRNVTVGADHYGLYAIGGMMNKGGNAMKKLIFKILFLTLVIIAPVSAMAEVSVNVNIPLPPPIIFPAPPEMVVIPETYVYAVPDVQEEIFFYNGWWWRLWEGRWYRSRYYDGDWVYFNRVPYFYSSIPPSWRDDYRHHRWRGQHWEHQRIPYSELQSNWRGWKKDRRWEKQNTWGVQGLQPRPQPQGLKPRPQGLQPRPQPQGLQPRPQPQGLKPRPQGLQPRPQGPKPEK